MEFYCNSPTKPNKILEVGGNVETEIQSWQIGSAPSALSLPDALYFRHRWPTCLIIPMSHGPWGARGAVGVGVGLWCGRGSCEAMGLLGHVRARVRPSVLFCFVFLATLGACGGMTTAETSFPPVTPSNLGW